MNVCVIGMNRTGLVTAACLARDGHHVIAVDSDHDRVDLINSGRSPFIEPGLDDVMHEAICERRLRAMSFRESAIRYSEITLICLEPFCEQTGAPNIDHLIDTCMQIGAAMSELDEYKVVAMRSPMPPDAFRHKILPALTRSADKSIDMDFGVVVNPSFMREGTAVDDFYAPSFTLIGATDGIAREKVASLYSHVSAPVYSTTPEIASMVKYVSTVYHGLNIVFANEIGRLCDAMYVDGQAVMEILDRDEIREASTGYLRPGLDAAESRVTGSVRTLLYLARENDAYLPVLQAIKPSNEQQIARTAAFIQQIGFPCVSILGISTKAETDSLCNSPALSLAALLLNQGYTVRLYDEFVQLDRLAAEERTYAEEIIPDFAKRLLTSVESAVKSAQVVVITHGEYPQLGSMKQMGQIIVDLRGMLNTRMPEIVL